MKQAGLLNGTMTCRLQEAQSINHETLSINTKSAKINDVSTCIRECRSRLTNMTFQTNRRPIMEHPFFFYQFLKSSVLLSPTTWLHFQNMYSALTFLWYIVWSGRTDLSEFTDISINYGKCSNWCRDENQYVILSDWPRQYVSCPSTCRMRLADTTSKSWRCCAGWLSLFSPWTNLWKKGGDGVLILCSFLRLIIHSTASSCYRCPALHPFSSRLQLTLKLMVIWPKDKKTLKSFPHRYNLKRGEALVTHPPPFSA